MALWNRLAESIYKLEILWDLMLLKGARPFKVKLYLICLNNNCFDFKPMLYILILIILNPGTLELWKGESIKHREADQLHRLARLAGRVIENSFVSVTIDVLI